MFVSTYIQCLRINLIVKTVHLTALIVLWAILFIDWQINKHGQTLAHKKYPVTDVKKENRAHWHY